MFASETSFDGIGYNKSTGIFSYSKGTYTQEKYDADLKKDEAIELMMLLLELRLSILGLLF